MLEVLAYKKYKKHKLAKELREANAKEALSKQDEEFIRHSIGNTNTGSSNTSMFKFLQRRKSSKDTVPATTDELDAMKTKDEGTTTPTSQEEDLARVLASLNLAVEKKTAFSLSDETRALLKEFTQILKDISAGAPHAYDDLTSFLHKSNAQLNSLFDSTPDFVKSIIPVLPFPLAKKLDKKSPKEVGIDILKDLAKPGVISGLLQKIMTLLRTRFPAFVGSNALLSLGVFVLLFAVWYCYKRGREERMKAEGEELHEVLVEGAKPQSGEVIDHGDGIGMRAGGGSSVPEASVEAAAVDNTPLQVKSEPVPPPRKKSRKSWLKSS